MTNRPNFSESERGRLRPRFAAGLIARTRPSALRSPIPNQLGTSLNIGDKLQFLHSIRYGFNLAFSNGHDPSHIPRLPAALLNSLRRAVEELRHSRDEFQVQLPALDHR